MSEQAEVTKTHTQQEATTGSSQTSLKASATSYIVVEQATKSYSIGSREVPAVRGVSLTIRKGEMVALRGRSGSGKTTLLNLIGGLDRPTSGKVLVADRDVGAMSETELVEYRRTTVGFIFQHFALLALYSALENVVLPLRIAGHSRALAQERALQCLELVELQERVHHRPSELSGGQQQRVGIARALALKPAVLLADEPTGNLDLRTGISIMRLLRQVAEQENMAVLVATHDPAMMDTAHRVLELRDGRLLIDEQHAH